MHAFAAILQASESSSKVSRRLCTAEVRGSTSLGSTPRKPLRSCDAVQRYRGTQLWTRPSPVILAETGTGQKEETMQSYQSSNSFSIHDELLRDAGDLDRNFRVNPYSSYF